ncbi:MAG: ribosome silencing factor [Desulfovibrionaceae bacterium]|jgi:ribosome-associated protein|nr:ribosome silencing factor [Desulfovibrionaceae bacterium]
MTETKKYNDMPSGQKVTQFIEWLEEKQATEIVALRLSGISPLAEAMIVATTRGVRHAQGVADHLLEKCRELNIEYFGMEGYKGSDWVLVDCNDVIVHLFHEAARTRYNLEGLWARGEMPVRPPQEADDDGDAGGNDADDDDADVFDDDELYDAGEDDAAYDDDDVYAAGAPVGEDGEDERDA